MLSFINFYVNIPRKHISYITNSTQVQFINSNRYFADVYFSNRSSNFTFKRKRMKLANSTSTWMKSDLASRLVCV